jgi:hypothetical protein
MRLVRRVGRSGRSPALLSSRGDSTMTYTPRWVGRALWTVQALLAALPILTGLLAGLVAVGRREHGEPEHREPEVSVVAAADAGRRAA